MSTRIVFATNNEGKMEEIKMIMGDLGLPVYGMKEVGIHLDVVEDGGTFEANALLKARALAEVLPDDIVLADDSGLEIDYLGKAPGVETANFAGRDTPYEIKNQMLIDELEGVPEEQRTARFKCVIVGIFPGGDCCKRHLSRHCEDCEAVWKSEFTGLLREGHPRNDGNMSFVIAPGINGEVVMTSGEIEGIIGYEIAGEKGFGYDPIFYLPDYGCTTAQLEPEVKNKLSHRGKALEEMKRIISKRM